MRHILISIKCLFHRHYVTNNIMNNNDACTSSAYWVFMEIKVLLLDMLLGNMLEDMSEIMTYN